MLRQRSDPETEPILEPSSESLALTEDEIHDKLRPQVRSLAQEAAGGRIL